jgi:hypothetical protein
MMTTSWTNTPGRQRRHRGQVLMLALLGIIALMALLLYVINVGDQFVRRAELQDSADATATAGATHLARSMNVIALNNCTEARLLAMVPIFDSAPLATEMSLNETEAWLEGLNAHLSQGVPDSPNGCLLNGLVALRDRIEVQRDILEAFDAVINHSGFDMRHVTFWRFVGYGGPAPHGSLWRTAEALEAFSRVTWRTAPELAQANAIRYGRVNGIRDISRDGRSGQIIAESLSVMLPVLPHFPAREGDFLDFQPVLEGEIRVRYDDTTMQRADRNGGGIPDFEYPHRLGPWAKLFPQGSWRDRWYEYHGGTYVPGSQTRGSSGSVGGGRTVGSSIRGGTRGYWIGGWSRLIGYSTLGPYEQMLRHLSVYTDDRVYLRQGVQLRRDGALADTFFYQYMRQLSDIKLDYMFDTPEELARYHYPLWVHTDSYDDARSLATAGAALPPGSAVPRVYQTLLYKVEFASSVPPTSASYESTGTYRTNSDYPTAIWLEGWYDPAVHGLVQIADNVWMEDYTYQTTEDREIGIYPRREDPNDPDSPHVFQTVYVRALYVWGGIDVGGDVEVRNPCNYTSADSLPVPILFDPGPADEYDYDPTNPDADEGVRREHYTFLGLSWVREQNERNWPDQFEDNSPAGSSLAVGQAKLFNNASWDLWTAGWQVQLVPVTDWDDWVQRAMDGQLDAAEIETLDTEYFDRLVEYMSNIYSPMADRYFSH